MVEPTLTDLVKQIETLTRKVGELHQELAATKAELRSVSPPPAGWLVLPNWVAADKSGRYICMDAMSYTYSHGRMSRVDFSQGYATPYDAAAASDLGSKTPMVAVQETGHLRTTSTPRKST